MWMLSSNTAWAAFLLCLVKMGRAYTPTLIATSSLHCPACPSPIR